MKNTGENLKESTANLAKETQSLDTPQLLALVLERFGNRVALASSFGAEDQVLIDMLSRISIAAVVFTLDTGRLPQETYDVIEQTRKKYGMTIQIVFPDSAKVENMVKNHGPNLFYDSVENRKSCCAIRKVEPLKRFLSQLDAWIVGLRKEQSVTRTDLQPIEWDEANELIKVSPLINWTTEQVWSYIRKNDVPVNKLHDKGYPSIGCAPCTRAIKPGEDIRAGRWWWENPEHKECGLHVQ